MNSIRDLDLCAERHLRHYTDPAGGRAFWAYDRQGEPNTFEPVDALAPGLLDAAVPRALVVEMFAEKDTPATALRHAMQHLLDESAGEASPRFEDLDLDDKTGPWALMRNVLRCTDPVTDIRASKASKMLHRKRPAFVPIFDSKVAAFYGVSSGKPWDLWPLLQADLRANRNHLCDLAAGIRTADDRALTPLRVLDIVIWEHQVTNCAGDVPS